MKKSKILFISALFCLVGTSCVNNQTPTEERQEEQTVAIETIQLNTQSVEIFVGDNPYQLSATVTPSNATEKYVWSVGQTEFASVSNNGLVTPLKAGTTNVFCKSKSGLVTASCTFTIKQHITSIEINEKSVSLFVGGEKQLGVTVLPSDNTESVSWSTNNSVVATVDSNGLVKAISEGTATIFCKGPDGTVSDSCTVSVSKPVPTWTSAQAQIFDDHLYGFELPCIEGLSVSWDATTKSVIVESETVDSNQFNSYVDSIVALGFEKITIQENMYTLLKDIVYEEKTRTIDIDIFYQNSSIIAVCYDPFIYEWPTDLATSFCDSLYTKPDCAIPSINADRYFAETYGKGSEFTLEIDCYSETNLETEYLNILDTAGFITSNEKNEKGFFTAHDVNETIEISFAYSTEEKTFNIFVLQYNGWPSFAIDSDVDDLTQGSGTKLPKVIGAESYELIESSYDTNGHVSVLCKTDVNLESQYEEALRAEGYTIYNDKVNSQNNYFAISENNDLLVQYKFITKSYPGLPDYSEFDVFFEHYYPYNEQHVLDGLQIILEGTTTTIPEFPGYGQKITFSDNDIYMNILIQSSYNGAIESYLETLNQAGWYITVENEVYFEYEAFSPERDIKLTTSVDNNLRPVLSISATDPWPTEGVNATLEGLGANGEVPVFEGAFEYLCSSMEYHDVVCFVAEGEEETLIENYNAKLEDLGWTTFNVNDKTYYVKEGNTVGIRAYYVVPGSVLVEMIYCDGISYDVDVRQDFKEWKEDNFIESEVEIPGLNLTDNVAHVSFYYDTSTYTDYSLFEALIEIDNLSLDTAINEIESQFENDGWEYSSSDGYYHKGDAFMFVYEWNGLIALDVCLPTPELTLDSYIHKFLKDNNLLNTVSVPESCALTCSYSIEDGSLYSTEIYLDLIFQTSSNATTCFNQIKTLFVNANWSVSSSQTNNFELVDETGNATLYVSKSNNKILFHMSTY